MSFLTSSRESLHCGHAHTMWRPSGIYLRRLSSNTSKTRKRSRFRENFHPIPERMGFQVTLIVKSIRGTQFRQWANKVLKEYLLKGYSINRRLSELEKTVALHSEKIDFFVRTSLPPVEGIFYDGQIFDAYKFATDLIKSAKESLVLIDNYVDESVLLMLSKRNPGVSATVYTQRITPQLQLDLDKHNDQYPPINMRTYRNGHDRFLIIDDREVYHIGSSLKDLGKKMFAFSRLSIPLTYSHT